MKKNIIIINSQKLQNISKITTNLFSVNKNKMLELISYFQREMKNGLAAKPGSLPMIPSYMTKPGLENLTKKIDDLLALDFGGTNLRVLKINFKKNTPKIDFSHEKPLPKKIIKTTKTEELFDWIAQEIKVALTKNNCLNLFFKLGFTFSFNYEQIGPNKGKINIWSKGFSAKDAIGKDPVLLLQNSLAKIDLNNIKITALINDTTGTLLSCTGDKNVDLGMILGTGTNICLKMPVSLIKKPLYRYSNPEMIVVTESACFDLFKTDLFNKYDKIVDANSINKGEHSAEKMMSGKYLGEIFQLILQDILDLKNTPRRPLYETDAVPTRLLSEIEHLDDKNLKADINQLLKKYALLFEVKNQEDALLIKRICELIKERSAKITAIQLAGTTQYIDPKMNKLHTVAMDGSLYKKDKLYQEKVAKALAELNITNIQIKETNDGSGIGAAIAAMG